MLPKVLFIHIRKCGGTSLMYSLLDLYPRCDVHPVPVGRSTAEHPFPHFKVEPETYQIGFDKVLLANHKLVMGHYTADILDRLDDDWHVITMLRHPVRQLYSAYRFIGRATDLYGDWWEREAKAMGFGAWLDVYGKEFANAQCRAWGLLGEPPATRLALCQLNRKKVTFGLVERYADSIDLFKQRLGLALHDPLHYNAAWPNTLWADIGPDEWEKARWLQREDIELYKQACLQFEKQFHMKG